MLSTLNCVGKDSVPRFLFNPHCFSNRYLISVPGYRRAKGLLAAHAFIQMNVTSESCTKDCKHISPHRSNFAPKLWQSTYQHWIHSYISIQAALLSTRHLFFLKTRLSSFCCHRLGTQALRYGGEEGEEKGDGGGLKGQDMAPEMEAISWR